jgi:hypothetical protein
MAAGMDRSDPHMAKLKIEGSFVALATPFNEDGSLDFGAFRAQLELQDGPRPVLITGSTRGKRRSLARGEEVGDRRDGVRIVKELGLDRRYGSKIGPPLAGA